MKKIIILLLLVPVSLTSYSQNKDNKWTLGVSGSFVSFGERGINSIGERFNSQLPKVTVSRYLFAGLVANAGFTYGAINKIDGFFSNEFDYFSLDGNLRYDFNLSDENLVPYIGLGGSIVGAPSTIQGSKATPTLNFTFGGTFWISPQWGLNTQTTYKHSPDDFESMRSHLQISAGLVYSFSPRVMVYRLWDGRRN